MEKFSLSDEAISSSSSYANLVKPQFGCAEEESEIIRPAPGKCIKTRNSKDEKIFINICTSDKLPLPSPVSDERLLEILASDDPSSFRVPISLGEKHEEVDNSGKTCVAYDIVVHPDCLRRSDVFQNFINVVAIEGIENKYEMKLSRDFVVLKNKKCLGTPVEQRIRKKAKPWIADVTDNGTGRRLEVQKKKLIEESRGSTPRFTLTKKMVAGVSSVITCTVDLPGVVSSGSMNLELGQDRVLLVVSPSRYHLDIYLPLPVQQTQSTAHFNRDTKKLVISMPVLQANM